MLLLGYKGGVWAVGSLVIVSLFLAMHRKLGKDLRESKQEFLGEHRVLHPME